MKILVVEDEHQIAQSLKKGLEQEKYTVDLAFTGTDGYDLASSDDYSLIILDLMLPGIDGLTICQKLRSNNIHTPILILTARGLTEDKITLLNTGADDYLTKPFSFEELLARIRALIRRPKDIITSIVSVGNLSLDTVNFKVTLNKQEIKLSSREFTLLEFLMRNAGVVLTKEKIISRLWDYDSEVLPNTVEVYIRNLRQKIGKNYIETLRGFGYRLANKNV
ncbi:MAG: response regulator transcription factor [Candidatus Shapirobacteria bacterium]